MWMYVVTYSANINAAETKATQVDEHGKATFVTGNVGMLSTKPTASQLSSVISNAYDIKISPNVSFEIKDRWLDELGMTHIRLNQSINGIPVVGANVTLHLDKALSGLQKGESKSAVYAVTGIVAQRDGNTSRTEDNFLLKNTSGDKAIIASDSKQVTELARQHGDVVSSPKHVYVYLPLSGETRLAWQVEVSWNNGGTDFGQDKLFYDTANFDLLTRHPQIYPAKSWKTYDLQNQNQNAAPGVLKCTNNQNCNDASAQRAHDGASIVYDYYLSRFNRDSINNAGMTMVSSVHLGYNVANAYWTGSQMMYGDGDGNILDDLTLSFDVIGHELTHGVTQYTAGLIYNNASGALNEAWSDIIGVTAKAYRDNTTVVDWNLAEESYTPNTPGDAMRYMKNPTADNYSKDWYPERIPFTSNPNNNNDYGGVHGNSGIANLAFALLVDGGSHPRGKSPAQVPGIGVLKAEQIFYRALTTYMSQSTNFSGARTATAQAAQDLYGSAEKTAVETAWCAVGVGTCPTDNNDPVVLQNGVAQVGITGGEKSNHYFTLNVPSGSSNLTFTTAGGSGDADLYVKFASQASLTDYDCKSETSTSNETCSISNIQAGTYHVTVHAWNAISDVSVTGSFNSGSGLQPINEQETNISVGTQAWTRYWYDLPAGYSSMTISTSGGTGDVDLYVRFGSQSSLNSYDCRPWKNGNSESCTFNNPASGRWYLDLYGYTAASGVTLTLQANP